MAKMPERSPLPTNAFRRRGEFWIVVFDGRSIRVADSKGPRYIARLLARPGEEIHVTDLVEGVSTPRRAAAPSGSSRDDRIRKAVMNRMRETIARIADLHPELGLHLTRSVRTGAVCAYVPVRPVSWEV